MVQFLNCFNYVVSPWLNKTHLQPLFDWFTDLLQPSLLSGFPWNSSSHDLYILIHIVLVITTILYPNLHHLIYRQHEEIVVFQWEMHTKWMAFTCFICYLWRLDSHGLSPSSCSPLLSLNPPPPLLFLEPWCCLSALAFCGDCCLLIRFRISMSWSCTSVILGKLDIGFPTRIVLVFVQQSAFLPKDTAQNGNIIPVPQWL